MTNTPKVEQVDERTPAQFFFEIGFGACLAEAFVRNDAFPFTVTDEIITRAWAIAGEAHEDPGEFDHYLSLANEGHRPGAGEDRLREALRNARATLNWVRFRGRDEDQISEAIEKIDAALLSSGPVEMADPEEIARKAGKALYRRLADDSDRASPPPDTEARARKCAIPSCRHETGEQRAERIAQISRDVSSLPGAIARLQQYADCQRLPMHFGDHGPGVYFADVRAVLAALASGRGEAIEECARVVDNWTPPPDLDGDLLLTVCRQLNALASSIRDLGKRDG